MNSRTEQLNARPESKQHEDQTELEPEPSLNLAATIGERN
jgi:hypothetical protein